MRFALISDIHGNRWALGAVLEHIARQRVDAIWNLGDILSGPPAPAAAPRMLLPLPPPTHRRHRPRRPPAAADMLLPLALPTIRGNCERGLLDCAACPGGLSDQFAFDHTDAHHRAWLAGL